MLFVIYGTVIELEIQIPLMQHSVQLDGLTSFILHVVITIYIQLLIKTLSCSITICRKVVLVSRTRVRTSFELANILMNENNLNEHTSAQEGLNLSKKLCQIFFSL